jgi:hypothetical protein
MLDYLQGIEGDIINIVEVFRCQLNIWFVDSCRSAIKSVFHQTKSLEFIEKLSG